MGIKYADALERAVEYWELVRDEVKFDKSKAAGELAAFGLFKAVEISRIIGVTESFVILRYGSGPNVGYRKWNISALSTLYLVAREYRVGRVNESMIKRLVETGNSARAVSELTGIPRDRVRGIVLE